jgi:hypothetical protein
MSQDQYTHHITEKRKNCQYMVKSQTTTPRPLSVSVIVVTGEINVKKVSGEI